MQKMNTMETYSPFTNDSSNNTVDEFEFVLENYVERVIIAFFYCVVVVVGVVGNSLVILAVAFSRRLRSSTNWFVINLAFADLLTCLSLPFGVTALLSKDGWPLPEWICATSAAIGFVCIGVSVVTLALIAYNRWYLLTQPRTKFKQFYCIRNISIMLGIAWLYSFLLVLVPHFAGLGKLGYSPRYKFCWHDTTVDTSDYYSLLAGPGLILPFAITIIVVYIQIYVFVSKHNRVMRENTSRSVSVSISDIGSRQPRKFALAASFRRTILKRDVDLSSQKGANFYQREHHHHHHQQQQQQQQQQQRQHLPTFSDIQSHVVSEDPDSVTVSGVTETHHEGDYSTTEHERRRRTNTKSRTRQYQHHVSVTKRLSVVVIVFFICLLPFGISSVAPGSEPGIPWTGMMTTFNSCLNPIIYAWTMPVFRRVMACIISCRLHSVPNPSRFIRPSR